MRMMSHFERRGFNPELIKIVHPKIQEEVQGDFAECFLEVLLARQRFQNILDSKAYFYQSLLVDLISIPEFKHKFMHLKNLKWIPG